MRSDYSVIVEIAGLKPPTTCDLTPAALDAIWAAIRFLPMPRPQHQFLERYLTGPCAERNITGYLAANPHLVIPVAGYELRIRWATPEEDPA
ncbi:hypothetical protein [Kitasatospora aureofaciens]|uniref:hypothetical protein n=1 Tax=Kitasatospora aureofaciens TaxID=1894 RepID=UPI00381A4F07